MVLFNLNWMLAAGYASGNGTRFEKRGVQAMNSPHIAWVVEIADFIG
jgi:hypothetical protein